MTSVALIDFRKTFYSVVKRNIWRILRKKAMNGKILPSVTNMYSVVQAKVQTGGDPTDSFYVS